MTESIMNSLKQMLDHLATGFEQFLPRVLVMLVIIIMGWLIAILSKAIVRRALASGQVRHPLGKRRHGPIAPERGFAHAQGSGCQVDVLGGLDRVSAVGN